MKRFSIPPREERERHSHTMSAYYHTVFAVRLSLLSFAVTALLPSQCCHHAAVTPLTFHNQTVKLQSVTDDSKFIFLFIGESISSTYKCNISFLLIGL